MCSLDGSLLVVMSRTKVTYKRSELQDGAYVAVDPDRKEEAAMTGQITCVLNKQQELCSIQKAGGVSIPVAMVLILPWLRSWS